MEAFLVAEWVGKPAWIWLAAMAHRFRYLKYALSLVLIFIGGKILWNQPVGKLDPAISLSVTFGLLVAGVLVSILRMRGDGLAAAPPGGWLPSGLNLGRKRQCPQSMTCGAAARTGRRSRS